MDKFKKSNLIGFGGFGKVWEVKRTEDNIIFACKEFNPNQYYDEKDIKRFEREIKTQAKLKHKNIVPIIEFSLESKPPFFIMPKAETNLDDFIKKEGHGEKNIWIIKELIEGLKYAHDNGVTHRDLKPQNILLFKDEIEKYSVKIGDFGLCKNTPHNSTTLTSTNIGMGTDLYSSPEQLKDAKNSDSRSDIYSLGKLIYYLLSGEEPNLFLDLEKIAKNFQHIVKKACFTDLNKRYQKIDEIISDIDFITSDPVFTTAPADYSYKMLLTILSLPYIDDQSITNFINYLFKNIDDYQVRMNILLKIPDVIFTQAFKISPDLTISIIKKYDESLESEFLPFDYCDSIAYFYKRFLLISDNYDLRITLLKRLFFLGPDYNRWSVGRVFASLVSIFIEDKSLLLFLKDLLNNNRDKAYWHKKYLNKYSLPPVLKEILDNLKDPHERDYDFIDEFEIEDDPDILY